MPRRKKEAGEEVNQTEETIETLESTEPEVEVRNGIFITPPAYRNMGGDVLLASEIDRSKIINDSAMSFRKGDFVYRANPAAQFRFAVADLSGVMNAKLRVDLRRMGLEPMRADEWFVSEEASVVVVRDAEGYLCWGSEDAGLRIYAQPKEAWDAQNAYDRRFVKDVGKSFEDRMAETGAKLAFIGARPLFIDETVGEKGELLSQKISNFTY